jgi:hypothetical protein
MSGVSSSTTDDVMVFFIEGDGATTLADLQGSTSGTQGDWITGTPYPIINPASTATTTFNNDYNIGYFPTIYMICPNRVISEVGQATTTNLYAGMSSCPPAATATADAGLITSFDGTATCTGSPVSLKTRLQNNSLTPLTSCTITATSGASTLGTINWTGNLATYEYEDVTVGTFSPTGNTNVTFTVTVPSDAFSGNNGMTRQYSASSTQATTSNVTVTIVLDQYPTETTWEIVNVAGTTVMSGGPYTSGQASTTVNSSMNLANDCYIFNIYDSYGDGICCAYGNGSYTVKSGSTTLYTGGSFATEETKIFKMQATSVDENNFDANVSIYPNPNSGDANINLELTSNENVTINVYNSVGQVVMSFNKGTLSAGVHTLNMDLSSLENGFYFVTVSAGEQTTTKKITLVK